MIYLQIFWNQSLLVKFSIIPSVSNLQPSLLKCKSKPNGNRERGVLCMSKISLLPSMIGISNLRTISNTSCLERFDSKGFTYSWQSGRQRKISFPSQLLTVSFARVRINSNSLNGVVQLIVSLYRRPIIKKDLKFQRVTISFIDCRALLLVFATTLYSFLYHLNI